MKNRILCCILLFLTGCHSNKLKQNIMQPHRADPSNTMYEINISITETPIDYAPWLAFLADIKAEIETDIHIRHYTDEGDPIDYFIYYHPDKKNYTLLYDNSKDRHAGSKCHCELQSYENLLSTPDIHHEEAKEFMSSSSLDWYLTNHADLSDDFLPISECFHDPAYVFTYQPESKILQKQKDSYSKQE